uniref:Uncharacterized protein n=1 Tax=viral metagenome TaxID=1070528 RepID=A0A6C0JWC5_9ZZZZ
MSTKEDISILTASVQTHFVAIGIFILLFGLFYVFTYTDQLKDMRNKMEKWRKSIYGYKIDYIDEPSNEGRVGGTVDSDPFSGLRSKKENEDDDEIDEHNNIREVLLPF